MSPVLDSINICNQIVSRLLLPVFFGTLLELSKDIWRRYYLNRNIWTASCPSPPLLSFILPLSKSEIGKVAPKSQQELITFRSRECFKNVKTELVSQFCHVPTPELRETFEMTKEIRIDRFVFWMRNLEMNSVRGRSVRCNLKCWPSFQTVLIAREWKRGLYTVLIDGILLEVIGKQLYFKNNLLVSICSSSCGLSVENRVNSERKNILNKWRPFLAGTFSNASSDFPSSVKQLFVLWWLQTRNFRISFSKSKE